MSRPLPSTSINGVLRIAKMIANNIDVNYCVNGDYYPKMSHKEVIGLAKIALSLGPVESFGQDVQDYIECLLWSITTYGMPHFTRSFAAKQIIITLENAIEEHQKKRKQSILEDF